MGSVLHDHPFPSDECFVSTLYTFLLYDQSGELFDEYTTIEALGQSFDEKTIQCVPALLMHCFCNFPSLTG